MSTIVSTGFGCLTSTCVQAAGIAHWCRSWRRWRRCDQVVSSRRPKLLAESSMCRLPTRSRFASGLARRFGLRGVALTAGADGASVVDRRRLCARASPVRRGRRYGRVGDAFSAALIDGTPAGADVRTIAVRANALGALVASRFWRNTPAGRLLSCRARTVSIGRRRMGSEYCGRVRGSSHPRTRGPRGAFQDDPLGGGASRGPGRSKRSTSISAARRRASYVG